MNICLVCTDPISIFFDKRILDIATTLKNRAHNITIITVGETSSIYSIGDHTILQIKRTDGLRTKSDICSSIGKLRENQIEVESNVLSANLHRRSFANKVGQKLEKKSKFLYFLVSTLYATARKAVKDIQHLTLHPFLTVKSYLRSRSANDFYLTDAEILADWLAGNNFDMLLGCDLPGALASSLVVKKNQIFWYDAHEYYSKQKWLENRVDLDFLEAIEKKILDISDIFSTVSTGLLDEMLKVTHEFIGQSYFLPNSSDPTRLNSETFPDLRKKLKINDDSKIAVFHGVLAGEYRKLDEFSKIFSQTHQARWHLLFIGYSASEALVAQSRKNSNIHLLDPISNHMLGSLLEQCNAILMPYEVVDLNTHYGLPNKMGDAIALKIPIFYNSKLVEINKWASEFQMGLPFDWVEIENNPSLLIQELENISEIDPDWNKIDDSLGWNYFRKTIDAALANLLRQDG